MTLESIEKMRELQGCIDGYYKDIEGNLRSRLMDRIDDLECELADKYMELPCDKHGRPIRIGDRIRCEGSEPVTVVGVGQNKFHGPMVQTDDVICDSWFAVIEGTYHVEKRTIEDVLLDVLHDSYTVDTQSIVTKYAEELRSMGVGE